MKKVLKIVFAVFAAWLLNACGSGDTWGIDQGSIPMCSSDVNDASVAIKVPNGSQINAVKSGTTLRVWHYSNSDKLVCVITGSAVVGGNS
jgi:hypothetical protein